MTGPPPPKTCRSCGRAITWRKQWARDWDEVRYCSQACRRRGVTAEDRRAEQAILDALGSRAAGLLELSEVHPVAGDGRLSEAEVIRRAARRLVAAGELELRQGGRVVDPSTAKGPLQVRRRRSG